MFRHLIVWKITTTRCRRMLTYKQLTKRTLYSIQKSNETPRLFWEFKAICADSRSQGELEKEESIAKWTQCFLKSPPLVQQAVKDKQACSSGLQSYKKSKMHWFDKGPSGHSINSQNYMNLRSLQTECIQRTVLSQTSLCYCSLVKSSAQVEYFNGHFSNPITQVVRIMQRHAKSRFNCP